MMRQNNIYFAVIVFVIGIALVSPYFFGNREPANAQLENRKPDGIAVTFFNNVTATSTGELISPIVDVAGFDSIHFHSTTIGPSTIIQRSVDGTTWINGQTLNAGFANYNIESKYYRLRISNATPGTVYYSKAYLKTTH
jgi:hypothetical protein